jgi:hypothetical protein
MPHNQARILQKILPPQFALLSLLGPVFLGLSRWFVVTESQVFEFVLRHEIPANQINELPEPLKSKMQHTYPFYNPSMILPNSCSPRRSFPSISLYRTDSLS